jgi:hypothetical protein
VDGSDVTDLGPFAGRSAELELYMPLVGKSMLELGNKKNAPHTYKEFFVARGFRHVSVDLNGQNGALALDLMQPLALGQFDMISNIGTTEHVMSQEPVWRNICEALHVGSVLVSTTPQPGDWQWHGFWHPTADFYRDLAALNGLSLDRLYVWGAEPRRMNFARLTRVERVPFVMPKDNLFRNPGGSR